MTKHQLKNIVLDKVSEIDDEELLQAIKKILESSSMKSIYKLSAEQRKVIRKSKQQIIKGESITNAQLEAEENLWLNE